MSQMDFQPPELSARVGFSNNPMLRHSEQRDNEAEIARFRDSPEACAVVLTGDRPILRKNGAGFSSRFPLQSVSGLGEPRETAFLGTLDGTPLFAVLLDPEAAEPLKEFADLAVIDLRTIATQGLLPPHEIGSLGEAKALTYWHLRHRFCSACGAPSKLVSGGWRRDCPTCGAQHFPRTDPVAIMLAVSGNRCLMGRQGRFQANMYSALAGFIEPGETIEDAVRREIHEEAGIRIGRVDYVCSQPWPFPASLMIGCFGEALGDEIVIDRTELEDARWFDRDEVALMLRGRHPARLSCPPPLAIAHHLLRAFVEGGPAGSGDRPTT